MTDIKQVIKVIDPETYLKFKVNRITQQRVNSSMCGYHAIKFFVERYAGKPFDQITGFDKMKKSLIDKSEDEVREFKNKILKFDYI